MTEEKKPKKSFSYYMRALHRDVGYFVVGLVFVYALSGMVLVYRNTDLLTTPVQVEQKLDPATDPAELGGALHIKGLKITKTEGDVVYFQNGAFNKSTGMATYTVKKLPTILEKFINLHKITSNSLTHWYAILFGALLCFLAISSFWMNKSGALRRGIGITIAGIIITVIVLIL